VAGKKIKKKRLPKDFEQMLEKGELTALQAVFAECDVNAQSGFGKRTALMLRHCPAELARWLVGQGADLAAVDTWGNTPLHAQARNSDGCVDALLDLGANVKSATTSGDTPLHAAADSKQAGHVTSLLARGADVNARNLAGLTPLEYALQRANNIDLATMAIVARILLDSGAQNTSACQGFVKKLGDTFEFHRAAFNKEMLPTVERGLNCLYELMDVQPVTPRRLHDGKARITVEATTWQKQFDELWNLMVPSSGPAQTVQGEVIRIAGRIGHEIGWNGGSNWDKDYSGMAQAICNHLQTGRSLPSVDVEMCKAVIDAARKQGEGDLSLVYQSAVTWVLINPDPAVLAKPDYTR
jgi:hypothetical protein